MDALENEEFDRIVMEVGGTPVSVLEISDWIKVIIKEGEVDKEEEEELVKTALHRIKLFQTLLQYTSAQVEVTEEEIDGRVWEIVSRNPEIIDAIGYYDFVLESEGKSRTITRNDIRYTIAEEKIIELRKDDYIDLIEEDIIKTYEDAKERNPGTEISYEALREYLIPVMVSALIFEDDKEIIREIFDNIEIVYFID